MTPIEEFLISRLESVYGKPKSDGFIAELKRACQGFTPHQLGAGCDAVLKANKFSRWPSIGEIYEACSGSARKSAHGNSHTEAPVDSDSCRAWLAPKDCQCPRCDARRRLPAAIDIWLLNNQATVDQARAEDWEGSLQNHLRDALTDGMIYEWYQRHGRKDLARIAHLFPPFDQTVELLELWRARGLSWLSNRKHHGSLAPTLNRVVSEIAENRAKGQGVSTSSHRHHRQPEPPAPNVAPPGPSSREDFDWA